MGFQLAPCVSVVVVVARGHGGSFVSWPCVYVCVWRGGVFIHSLCV